MVSQKLQVGQFVELKEWGHGFECTIVPPGGTGHEIMEVGSDYIVVKGDETVAWVRYPIYMLRFRETPPPLVAAA
jgi:hypothetical protein